ncbi:PDZ domain-containing protein [Rubritalea squalenifaciens DSM 18772]|uniref:PDZ domain-containing protein n=2 Tax=Rubritalea squalenifaciens TaxID=407226 RepID=A0A1M6HWV4_9BACT|nr:PDZ domain-containing protein [Rubritalea squalenifaciens DSM 18772]
MIYDMNKGIMILGIVGSLCSPLYAQGGYGKVGLPFLRERDAQVLDVQAASFYKAVEPLADKTRKHAVYVEYRDRVITLGTVTTEGIVTKWSEIKPFASELFIVGHDGVRRGVVVKAIYNNYDIAVLAYNGSLPAVSLENPKDPSVGSFIYLSGPGKGAHGFGVVSVQARSLREQDKAFLGVRMDVNPVTNGGVRLQNIEPDTAAQKAGLEAGDVVLKVGDREVNGMIEMGNLLQRFKPGDTVNLTIRRNAEPFVAEVTLGARPQFRRISPERMNRMRSMGGSVNDVADGFPDVLQSDMQIEARESGGPVFDLDGNYVGTVVARSSRIKTYIIPAADLSNLLKSNPDYEAQIEVSKPEHVANVPEEAPEAVNKVQRTQSLLEKLQRRIEDIER